MYENLSILAGGKAREIIKEEGLRPERIKVVAGAAGGPKWLVLYHLDRAVFSSWFTGRTEPLFLLGSSIGVWRFAALCQNSPLEAIDRFRQLYINQTYTLKPGVEEITREMIRILNGLMDEARIGEILGHPFMRLNVMATRCKGTAASDNKALLSLSLAGGALANAITRTGLRIFFERSLFYDPRDLLPFFEMDELPIKRVPLDKINIRAAVRASGSIPLVMSGVTDIPGAPAGTYRDGAVVDYHLDVPFLKKNEGLVLFPHYTDRVIPGWFDKKLPWRKPAPSNMDNVILVSPSKKFVLGLPQGKIPDRDDFRLFLGRDAERIDYWNKVTEESERLADEFIEAVETGRIRELVRPIH